METTEKNTITVEATVNQPVELVWGYWTNPVHIARWYAAWDNDAVRYTENDFRTGGRFKTAVPGSDGSSHFAVGGVYASVEPYRNIEYCIDDGRRVQVTFARQGHRTKITETFEADEIRPVELQRGGWQSILDDFNDFVESLRDD